VTYATGSEPYGVTAADFNGDGKLDLAVCNYGPTSDSVSVLLGNGDGTFQTAQNYPVGYGPSIVISGDFNGDGKVDLVTLNSTSATVSILFGIGNGTFQAQNAYPCNGCQYGSLTVADYNRDGRLDLASGFSVLLQAPAITLTPASLSFGNQNVGTTSLAQAVTLTNSGSLSFTISAASITGADPADFSQTNTCLVTLAPGSTCTITVTFTPTTSGARSASVSITDNAPGSPQTVALSGTGIASAVTLSATSLTFAAQLVGTTSSPQPVTLTNTGNAPLTVSSITATGAFSQTNNCGSTVAAGASCSLSVVFSPTTTGTVTGSVSISDNAPGSPQTIALSGTGVAPAAKLSTTNLTFAAQLVGTSSSPQVVTLTNTGTGSLTVSGITAAGAFSQTNNCTPSVAPGANCTINVVFSPTAKGTATGAVSIVDNAAGSPQTIALTGTGVAPAVKLSTTSLTFATQLVSRSSTPQAVTLTNTGNASLTVSSITNSGAFSQTNNCIPSVAAQAKCTINVVFTPAIKGTLTGTVSIRDNAAGSPQSISLTGTGTVVSLSTNRLNFGSETVGKTSAPKTVTLKNTGSTAVTGSFAITGADPADFAYTTTCPKSVAAGKSCTISVTFKPKAKGSRSATFAITDNGGGSPQDVALAGSGT